MKSIINITPIRKPLYTTDTNKMTNDLNNFYMNDLHSFSLELDTIISTILQHLENPKAYARLLIVDFTYIITFLMTLPSWN